MSEWQRESYMDHTDADSLKEAMDACGEIRKGVAALNNNVPRNPTYGGLLIGGAVLLYLLYTVVRGHGADELDFYFVGAVLLILYCLFFAFQVRSKNRAYETAVKERISASAFIESVYLEHQRALELLPERYRNPKSYEKAYNLLKDGLVTTLKDAVMEIERSTGAYGGNSVYSEYTSLNEVLAFAAAAREDKEAVLYVHW